MADPFAIIGLTASIISFIDFSLKIASAGKALYRSSSDTTDDLQELGIIVDDVRRKNKEFQEFQKTLDRRPHKDEMEVPRLASQSGHLASELESLLNDLKVRPGHSKVLEASRVVLLRRIKGKQIEELRDRLLVLDDRVRENMRWALQGNQESAFTEAIENLQRSQNALQIRVSSPLEVIKEDIQSLLKKSRDVEESIAQLTSLNTKLNSFDKEQKQQQRQVEVIKSLHFNELRRRWSQVVTADEFTNTWLFDESQTKFLDWLQKGKGMFWISGKPGSGKSTLMKFAMEQSQTSNALKQWAGSATLQTASFFFWNQGFEVQKSKVGLLQSLLYQILKQAPDSIPQMCYDHPAHEPWEFNELVAIFRFVTQVDDISSKFCFFIDGLDEYGGDEEDLSKMLSTISQGPYVKFCVSCRHRPFLESVFMQKEYSLAIHDFTKEDMVTHVRQQLRGNDKFNALEDSRTLFTEIVAKITEHAQGVWLWVYLVVRDLRKAVNNRESGKFLKEIIEGFPKDLEGYFDNIIKSIADMYRRDMVRIFRITLEEVQPLPLYAFSLLEIEGQHPRYAIEAKVSPMTEDELLDAETPWRSRILSRCGDLLLVTEQGHPVFLRYPVDFMHRTVRDYLNENLPRHIQELGDQAYNPFLSLCNIMLYLLKKLVAIDLSDPRLRKHSIHQIIGLTDELLYYAHEDDRSENPSDLVEILDEVDSANRIHAGKLKNHWTHARDLPRTRGLDEYREGGNCNFLALAVQARLLSYVKAKLESKPRRIHKSGRPLLDYALRPRRVTPIKMPYHSERKDPSVDVRMIKLLLDSGADPNQTVHLNEGRSVWSLFLLSIDETIARNEASPDLKDAWYEACNLLIEKGADPDCWLDTERQVTVESMMKGAFGTERAAKLTRDMRFLKAKNTNVSWFSGFWFNS